MNQDGRKWARWFLSLALLISVIGNVTHAWLAESTISLGLRVPGAVIWPLFAFFGIEVLVRVLWRPTFSHRFTRFMVLWPIAPAAITSYEHLHSLLIMMGETKLTATIGPGAIDGAMVGCTLVLLFTRVIPAPAVEDAPNLDEVLQRYGVETPAVLPVEEQVEQALLPVSAPPMLPAESAPELPRTTRAPRSSWDARKVAEMILDGQDRGVILGATGVTAPSYSRMKRVVTMLRENPRAEIPTAEKVSPENVEMIRRLVLR